MMQFASATIGTSEFSSRGFLFPLSGLFLRRDRNRGKEFQEGPSLPASL